VKYIYKGKSYILKNEEIIGKFVIWRNCPLFHSEEGKSAISLVSAPRGGDDKEYRKREREKERK